MALKANLLGLAVAGLATIGLATAAGAAPLISFDDAGIQTAGGSVTYSGDPGAPLIGTNISYSLITGTDTPLNSGMGGALTCSGCLLNLSTGGNILEGVPYVFGPGGTFTITGTALGSGGAVIATGTLLSGSFTTNVAVNNNATDSLTVTGFGVDTKNAALIAYFGLTGSSFEFANTDISLDAAVFQPNGGFTANVTDSDTQNSATPVPEPATLGLLGVGLLGLAAVRRARRPAV